MDHYDQGDVVHLTATYEDADGNAIDPSALTFTYTPPSGTSVTYTYGTDAQLVKAGTGSYYVDLTVSAEGLWVTAFVSTGAGAGREETAFWVDSLQTATESESLITVSEYMQYTNEDVIGNLPMSYILGIFAATSLDVQDWCGRLFGSQTVSSERTQAHAILYNRQPCFRVEVKQRPITAITSLSVYYAIDADSTTLAIDDAVIEAGGASFLVPFGSFGLWTSFFKLGDVYRAVVSYMAGQATPTNVKRAVALLAQEAFALDTAAGYGGTDDVESYRIGDYSEKKAARDLTASQGLGLGTQNSILAAQMLRRYKSQGVVFL